MLRCTIQDVSDVVTGKLGARRRTSKEVKRPVDEDELGNWFGREPSLGVEWDPVRPFLPLSICGEGHLERAVSSRKRQSKQAQEVISDEREREERESERGGVYDPRTVMKNRPWFEDRSNSKLAGSPTVQYWGACNLRRHDQSTHAVSRLQSRLSAVL